MYKMHPPEADTDRLHAERKGGRGLLRIAVAYTAEIINTAEYLNTNCKEDQFVNTVKSHEITQPNINSAIKTAAKFTEELSQSNKNSDTKQDRIQHTKAGFEESLNKKWKNKAMHGQYIRSIDTQLISEEDTFLWLWRGDLKAETESETVAAQDQALQTKYHETKILHTDINSKCRLTPWSRVLPKKLTHPKLLNKFPAFYGT
jgi:hypothetical protein